MGFGDSLGISLPSWLWSSSSSTDSSSYSRSAAREKKKSKKHARTRGEQNGSARHGDGEHYSGLVNISGTYCFMNSTLQALASLTYLQPHIDAIHAKAEVLDVPTPVIDALRDLFRRLNTPRSSYHSIRPLEIINVLSNQTEGRTNSLFYSREHQDAQELFQVLSECIKNEIAAVDKEGHRDRGLGGLSQESSETMREIGKSVFDGLTANRRSCVVCGYTEAVMHFAFDSWQLAVPRLAASCRLEDCLDDYTSLEILKDCVCRKCSVIATYQRLHQEVLTLEEATKPEAKPSPSKKRKLKEVKRMEARVKAAIVQGRIEEDLKDVRLEKVTSPRSTKQAMIARPPPILALHINRSVHFGQYASKNTIKLIFPEVLDLTPYTTSGSLSTIPTSAISTPAPAIPRSTTPTPSTYATPRTIYRLASVVCHYGQHSFGHYVCFRRKPRLPNPARWAPPKIVDPLKVEEMKVEGEGGSGAGMPEYVFEDDAVASKPGRGWLRISDDSVRECGIESVLQEGSGAFMLYYERAEHERSGIYPSLSALSASVGMSGSEETLKPEVRTVDLNGSVGSLVSEVGVGIKKEADGKDRPLVEEEEAGLAGSSRSGMGMSTSLVLGSSPSQLLGPRIVRSVTTGRARSSSATRSSTERESPASSQENSTATQPIPIPKKSPLQLNGSARSHLKEEESMEMMTASAPSILVKPHTNSNNMVVDSHPTTKPPPPPRIHSPQPHHPSPVVGLKA